MDIQFYSECLGTAEDVFEKRYNPNDDFDDEEKQKQKRKDLDR